MESFNCTINTCCICFHLRFSSTIGNTYNCRNSNSRNYSKYCYNDYKFYKCKCFFRISHKSCG